MLQDEVYRDDAAFDVHLNGPYIACVREAAGMILKLYGKALSNRAQPSKVAKAHRPARSGSRDQSYGYRPGAYRSMAADTTPTATGFAHRIERRDAVGLCKEPKASCDGADDGAVVHVDEREV